MTIRKRSGLLTIALLVPGLVAAQAGTADRLARRDELLAADRALSDSVLTLGYAEGVTRAATPDLAILWAGAPVIAGQQQVHDFLLAQTALQRLRLRWVPLYAEVSGDGTFGVSYGVTGVVPAGAADTATAPLRFAKYLSAWRSEPAGWRLVAQAQIGVTRSQEVTLADGFTPPPLPPVATVGALAAFADADRRFAAQAGRENAAAAFAAFAADDAVTFAPTGELTRGPADIRRAFTEEGTPSSWRWHPVIAGGAPAGDLGYTIGEAIIEGRDANDKPLIYYGKYLTLWRKAAKAGVRFLADGGNARPRRSGE